MSQVISRGKSPCVGHSPTVQMYFVCSTSPSSPLPTPCDCEGLAGQGGAGGAKMTRWPPPAYGLTPWFPGSPWRLAPRRVHSSGNSGGHLNRDSQLPHVAFCPVAPGSEEAQDTERVQLSHYWGCRLGTERRPQSTAICQPGPATFRSPGAERMLPGCRKAQPVGLDAAALAPKHSLSAGRFMGHECFTL